MASIHIVPIMDTVDNKHSYFKNIELVIFNGSRKVGEAKVILMDYNQIRSNGEHLDTVARHVSEDMHLAFSALSRHSLFSCEVLCDTDRMYCRVPIIAYLSRIYIYPEFRGKGYGQSFIEMLPDVIKNITLSNPLAIAVYICPQTKSISQNGTITPIIKKDIKAMQILMEGMFASAGYIKPSRAMSHKHCMCWTEGTIKQ